MPGGLSVGHGRDPMVPLLLLLSATTGLVDAVSVLGLGKVFTANMTGNVVFLGFALAGAPGFVWPQYVAALALFLVGAGVGGRLTRSHAAWGRRRGLMAAAVLEAGLIWAAAACALAGGAPAPEGWCLAMIALTAAAMGLRNATVRFLKVPDLTTTVLTLTLTGLAADAPVAGGDNANWVRRVAAVAAILAGAFVGGLMFLRLGLAAPLAVAGLVTLAATLGLARDVPAA